MARLSNNQSRVLYDFIVFAASAAVTGLLVHTFTGRVRLELLVVPVLGVAVNYLLGVTSRWRLATGLVKTAVLSASVLIVAACIWFITRDLPTCALWAALAWAPLVLPRIFLNLHRQRKFTGAIARTIQGVLKDRGPVLVVGGAGYIGTHVVAQLLAEGYPVRVLDRLFYGEKPIEEFLKSPKFEFIEGDVTDISKLVLALDGVSSVVHLAGLVGDPACSVDDRYTTQCNVIATRMLKEVAISFGVQRFVFASSCSVYGFAEEVVDESSALNPVSLYARTKIESEQELFSVLRDDFFVTVLRFATVFGHSRRPRFDLVGNLFTAQACVDGKITVQGGDQCRPFIHVSDLARAILLVLKADPALVQGEVFNVGDERLNMTIGELAQSVHQVVKRYREAQIISQDTVVDKRNYTVSFDKIQRVLGFRAQTLLEPGIAEIVQHFENGDYANYKLPQYSNLEVTREVVIDFHNPEYGERLYAPLSAPKPQAAAANS